MINRRVAGLACAGLLLLLLLPGAGLDARRSSAADRIDDAAFWGMLSEFSEPSGYFRSDNLVSNERAFPAILPEVRKRTSSTGAYLGVGPEQNFSYLAALRPRLAFIVDVRRQNAILHLLYKALFETSPTRAEFLSRLFSRYRPRHLGPRSSARDLFQGFSVVPPSADLFEAHVKAVRSHLVGAHHFALTEEDLKMLRQVYSAFYEAGPELQYSSRSFGRGRPFPSFVELMTANDDHGVAGSFLATEENYQALRELQQRNLIVPVVGDFAGPKALKAVGTYLRQRRLTVSVFYTSNVEFYLFRGDQWRSFYGNVAALPVDRRSVLIRSIFRGPGMSYPGTNMNGRLVIEPIEDLVTRFRRGEISGYGDLIGRSR
jgi:hypothetical protein